MAKNGKNNRKDKNSDNGDNHKVTGRIGNGWRVTKNKAKDRAQRAFNHLRYRNTAIVDTTPHKLLVIITSGAGEHSWGNVMGLYKYIRDKLDNKIDSLKLADPQDPEGRWTLKLVIEFRGSVDAIKTQITKRAGTISAKPEGGCMPGGNSPAVKFEELDE